MTAIIVSNAQPFGSMTNKAIADLFEINRQITRVASAVADAASGYSGTAGTEYEGTANNFGVLANSTPGEQGAAYAYAVGVLAAAWTNFWTAASPSIQALDNGVPDLDAK